MKHYLAVVLPKEIDPIKDTDQLLKHINALTVVRVYSSEEEAKATKDPKCEGRFSVVEISISDERKLRGFDGDILNSMYPLTKNDIGKVYPAEMTNIAASTEHNNSMLVKPEQNTEPTYFIYLRIRSEQIEEFIKGLTKNLTQTLSTEIKDNFRGEYIFLNDLTITNDTNQTFHGDTFLFKVILNIHTDDTRLTPQMYLQHLKMIKHADFELKKDISTIHCILIDAPIIVNSMKESHPEFFELFKKTKDKGPYILNDDKLGKKDFHSDEDSLKVNVISRIVNNINYWREGGRPFPEKMMKVIELLAKNEQRDNKEVYDKIEKIIIEKSTAESVVGIFKMFGKNNPVGKLAEEKHNRHHKVAEFYEIFRRKEGADLSTLLAFETAMNQSVLQFFSSGPSNTKK